MEVTVVDMWPWPLKISQSLCMDSKSSPLPKARLLERVSIDTFSACYVSLAFVGYRASSQGQQEDLEPRGGLFVPWGQGCFTKLAVSWKDGHHSILLSPGFVIPEIINKGSFCCVQKTLFKRLALAGSLQSFLTWLQSEAGNFKLN